MLVPKRHPYKLKFEILSTKHEMVRSAHHPEPSRRTNSNNKIQMTKTPVFNFEH